MENSYKNPEFIKISETIRALRQSRGINQEVLADALSVSTQAVSKWETGSSLPDVTMIPRIAGYFGVSTDHLYFGGEVPEPAVAAEEIPHAQKPDSPFPEDGVLRVVQFMGSVMLSAEEAKAGEVIELSLGEAALLAENSGSQIIIPTEVYGSAIINGTVNGSVKADGDVNCGTVNGNAAAGLSLKCATVNGSVSAGGDVIANRVMGNVSAGGRAPESDIRKFEQEFERKFNEEWEREVDRAAERADRHAEEWDREAERADRRAERRESRSFERSFGRDFGREMGRLGKELGRAFSFGKKQSGSMPDLPFPDDGVLRVVQFVGQQPVSWKENSEPMQLEIGAADQNAQKAVQIEIYGNADINGGVNGNVTADGSVGCADVGGNVTSDGDVSCAGVGGSVVADGDVQCGDVGGAVTADGDVQCGDVGGGVTTDGDVQCGDVGGGVTTDGDVSCGNISGNVTAEGSVECGSVGGNISADGDISCGDVVGSVSAEGEVSCGIVSRDVSCEGNLSCGDILGNVKNCEGNIECGDIGGNISCEGDIIRK